MTAAPVNIAPATPPARRSTPAGSQRAGRPGRVVRHLSDDVRDHESAHQEEAPRAQQPHLIGIAPHGSHPAIPEGMRATVQRILPWANARPPRPRSAEMVNMEQEPAIDAYSAAVIRVAESVLPSVAAVSVRTSRGAGAGSASVISADGHLLTSAHVVAGAEPRRGRLRRRHRARRATWSVATRCPTSRCCAPTAPRRRRCRGAMPQPCASASSSSRSAIRSGSPAA